MNTKTNNIQSPDIVEFKDSKLRDEIEEQIT